MSSKKVKEKKSDQPVEVPKNNILIRYSNFENPFWNGLLVTLIRNVGRASIAYNKYHDEKTVRKSITDISTHKTFSCYKKSLKFLLSFQRLIKLFEAHQNNYNQQKQNLLKQYGKFDESSNQFVLLEPEKVQLFNQEFDKLKATIVQIDVLKFSPTLIADDFDELFEEYRHTTSASNHSNMSKLIRQPYTFTLFFDLLNDVFDMDEIYSWKYQQDVDDIILSNFGMK